MVQRCELVLVVVQYNDGGTLAGRRVMIGNIQVSRVMERSRKAWTYTEVRSKATPRR
jgi:hypothetical protein